MSKQKIERKKYVKKQQQQQQQKSIVEKSYVYVSDVKQELIQKCFHIGWERKLHSPIS